MKSSYDLVIVGGGIGGSALATAMSHAGLDVLLLEKSLEHIDRVRGEWLAPWGVQEAKELNIYDAFIAGGGHHISAHVGYDEAIPPELAEQQAMQLDLLPGISGPMCLGHPKMCRILNAQATQSGATLVRGVQGIKLDTAATPSISFRHDNKTYEIEARLIVGADGRSSTVRKQAGIELDYDPIRHFFGGMLVEGATDLPDDKQWIGTEGDVHYLCFPQGNGKARLYLGFSPGTPSRFSGKDGPQKFLEAFAVNSAPPARYLANATPAGPVHAYPNSDSWTATPYTKGVVLIGDAAGHNDPINGQGLSITLRDVRMIRDLLLSSPNWSEELFAPYAEERSERMRRLRFVSRLVAELSSDFTEEGIERRKKSLQRQIDDPQESDIFTQAALIIGPEQVPEETYSQATWDRFLKFD